MTKFCGLILNIILQRLFFNAPLIDINLQYDENINIDNDDKYISERESPDDERASINCIGKRIAGWFLRYMRVSIIGVVSYRKSLILYMRPCSSSRGKPAPRIRPGTELNSPRYTLSAYILTTRMGGTGTPISV